MRRLLVALIVVGLLAVGLDFGAKMLAERTVADEIASARGFSTPPSVDIEGFPFLLQAWRGRLSAVTVHSADVQQDEISLRDVRATFTDVDAPIRQIVAGTASPRFTAARAQVRGTVDYSSLAAALKARAGAGSAGQLVQVDELTAGPGPDGAVLIAATVTVMGTRMPVSVPVKLAVADGALTLTASATGGDAAGNQAARTLVDTRLPIPELPYGLTVQQITAGQSGIVVSAAASGVDATG